MEKEDFLGDVIGDLDIDEVPYARTGSFRLEDWFRPYPVPGAVTNPLTWPEEIGYWYQNERLFSAGDPDEDG